MAKGKGKKVSSGGVRKNHGPKKHLFKEYKPMIKAMADAGLLTKYNNYDSFVIACQARGKRNPTIEDFKAFSVMTRLEQDQYLKNLSK